MGADVWVEAITELGSETRSSIRRNFASSIPEIESLKFFMALPNVLPKAGNRRGPKIRSNMPKTKRCSPDIPNIRHLYRFWMTMSIVLLGQTSLLKAVCLAEDAIKPGGANAYQKVTGDDQDDDRSHWDKLYNTKSYVYGTDASEFLQENISQLPKGGKVLDIATGEGRNAVFLAKKGFNVEGVDISQVALRKAKRLAKDSHVSIHTTYADLTTYAIKAESYQVILNIDYLQRSLIPQIKKGLIKGGVVLYENYTVDQLKNTTGRHMRRDDLLEKGELKSLFNDFEILVYKETNNGKDAIASLLARKK